MPTTETAHEDEGATSGGATSGGAASPVSDVVNSGLQGDVEKVDDTPAVPAASADDAPASKPHVPALLAREPLAISAVGACGVLLLVATLVPLLLISGYNHSYADDWHYGVWAHLTLQETGNVFLAIVTALEQVGKAWFEWQGTYSAIFLMAIEPGVFGEQFYVLAAPIVLATFIGGTLFFTHVVLRELLGAERGVWLAVSCAALAVQLLLQPSPVEGIFWYNSAVYYTTYHGAALALMGCLARIANPRRQSRPRGVLVASCLLAVFVAGGNFVTALVVAEVMFAMLVVLIMRGRRSAMAQLPPFALMVVGLALSLAAPGNEVRQVTQFPEDGMGVWDTIWNSSLACFQYIQQWSTGIVLLLAVMCAPLALRVARRAAADGWHFPLPALVAVGSVALFATSFTPTFWAQGSPGPGRVQNCRFDLFVVLVLLNLFWVCGWLAAQRLERGECSRREPISGDVAIAFGLTALVAVCVAGSMAADKDLGEQLSSVSAARSVASGQAAAYDEQVWQRLETIESSSASSLTVPFYTNVPHVLLMGDIRDNMNNYINYRLAQWYGKDSIIGYYAPTTASQATGSSSGA